MSDRFDEIRSENPDLAINLYAMTPGGGVTLEVITPDGRNFTWAATTAAAAMELAFPASPEPNAKHPICPNTGLPCIPSCTRETCAGLHIPLNEWPMPVEDADADALSEPQPTSIFD